MVVPIEISQGKSTKENTINMNIELLDAIPFYNVNEAQQYTKELEQEKLFNILVKVNEDGTFEF